MNEKTIAIKKRTILNILVSFLLGFITLFIFEHFGKFSYIATSAQNNTDKISLVNYIDANTEVTRIYYATFFGNKVDTEGFGFTAGDLNYSDTDFDKYRTKVYFFQEALKLDYVYGIVMAFGIYFLLWLFSNFKFKLI